MNKLIAASLLTLTLASGSALAEVKIKGNSTQTVNIKNGGISNVSAGMSKAVQNVSSNKGKVTIDGTSRQTTNVENGGISNVAAGALADAEQNVASNSGD